MRRGAIVLIVIGCLFVPLADVGIWVQRVVLRTGEFTALADDILRRDAVRDALASEILEEIEQSEPRAGELESVVQPLIRDALGTPEFDSVFRRAVGRLHGQLVDDGDELSLDLDEGLELVRQRIAQFAPEVLDEVPTADEFGDIVITTRDQSPYLWWAVQVANVASVAAIVAVIGFLAFGIALPDRRWLALGIAGIGVAAASLLLVVISAVAQSLTSNWASQQVDERAFAAVWDVFESSLLVQTLLVALIGVAMAVVGFLGEFGSTRQTVR